jgi:pseudouridine synthase
MAKERLDKLMASTGRWSRREAKIFVKEGRVLVDGIPAASADDKFDPAVSKILVDGVDLGYRAFTYVMLHKPDGVLTATEDKRQKTVLDLLTPELQKQGLFPVGRLDRDTEGLLLLTNDGDLTYKLTHPKHDVDKTYIAKLYGIPDEGALQKFRRGVTIDGVRTKPAKIQIIEKDKDGRFCTAEIIIHEGRNRQVRKMCEAIKHPVAQLQRVATGDLKLGNLEKGKYRHLTDKEVKYLKR